jgi:chromosome segregation ATPase
MKKATERVRKVQAAVAAAQAEIADAALARRDLQDGEAAGRLGSGPTAAELKRLRATVQKGEAAEEALPGLQRQLEDALEQWREAEIARLTAEAEAQHQQRQAIDAEVKRIQQELTDQLEMLRRFRMKPNPRARRIHVERMPHDKLIMEVARYAD